MVIISLSKIAGHTQTLRCLLSLPFYFLLSTAYFTFLFIMLPSSDIYSLSSSVSIEQKLSELYRSVTAPESLWAKLSRPAAAVPILTLFASVVYLWLQAHISHHRRLHPTPFEIFVEAIVYLTPARLLWILDDIAGPSLFPKAEELRARTHEQKLFLARNIYRAATTRLSTFMAPMSKFAPMRHGFRDSPVGLHNSTRVQCYANATIQGLTTTPIVEHLAGIAEDSASTPVSHALLGLLAEISQYKNKGLALRSPRVLNVLGSREQEDPQEYLVKLIDKIEEEEKRAKRFSSSESTERDNGSCSSRSPSNESRDSGYGSSCSSRSNPLIGTQVHRLACTRCGYATTSTEPFINVNIPLFELSQRKSVRLVEKLREVFALELIHGARCNKCTLLEHKRMLQHHTRPSFSADIKRRLQLADEMLKRESFEDEDLKAAGINLSGDAVAVVKVKQHSITKPPNNLVMYLMRNHPLNQIKLHTKVSYPEILDLSPYLLGSTDNASSFIEGNIFDEKSARNPEEWCNLHLKNPKTRMLNIRPGQMPYTGPIYRLSAVICHRGFSAAGGHYTCFRREPFLDKCQWWHINDEKSFPADKSDVMCNDKAVMLFYECIDPVVRTMAIGTKGWVFAFRLPVHLFHRIDEKTSHILQN